MSENAKPSSMYYIGPGGLMFVLSAIPILVAALYTQANLLFWSFGLLVGGLICSMLMSWLMMRGLTVERVLPPHAVAGEPTAIRYQVTNHKRWLPVFSLVVAEEWPAGRKQRKAAKSPGEATRLRGKPSGWVLHVGPRQSVLAEAPCWPIRRGVLTFHRIEISSAFPFGMMGRRISFPRRDELTVLPHLFRIRKKSLQPLLQSDPNTTRRVQAIGISEEFYGLRDYRPGDRMRSIDWKRSARTGKLVAKETARPGVTRVLVMLDLRPLGPQAAQPLPAPRPSHPRFDILGRPKPVAPDPKADPGHPWVDAERTISLAASILVDAYFQGLPIGLVVRGARCPTFRVHRSLPHRAMILGLARLDLSQRTSPDQDFLAHPTVIIRPGAAGAAPGAPSLKGPNGKGAPGNGNAGSSYGGNSAALLMLNAADLEQLVTEIEGGANAWLTAPASKSRREAREVAAWR